VSLLSSTLTGAIAKSSPTQPKIATEIELLLCCARTVVEPHQTERIRGLVQQPINWEWLLELAIGHAVMPLLAKNLTTVCPDAIPETVGQQLRAYSYQLTLRNLSLTGELCRLLQLLKEHDIQAIPFKGPILAASVYGNIALRQFGDLDIWVHPRDFLKARTLLLLKGEYCVKPSYFLTEEQEISHLLSGYECSLYSADGQVALDLHQELSGGTFFAYPVQFEEMWERLELVSVAGSQLQSLQYEDLLLYLCVHGSKSLWERLGWICDVAEFVQAHPTIDWERMLVRAQLLYCERMLILGLLLANRLLDTPLSETVSQRIHADLQSQSLANQVCNKFLLGKYGITQKINLEKFMFNFRVLNRRRDRLMCIYKNFVWHGLQPLRRLIYPTQKDYSFLPLPPSFYPLYYLIRPFRLIHEYRKITH